MISNIVFIDNDNTIKICVAWVALKPKKPDDPTYSDPGLNADILAQITGMSDDWTKREVNRLQRLGILLPDCKIDEDVEKYIDTLIAGRITSIKAGKEVNK